jgi:hypothetical protein
MLNANFCPASVFVKFDMSVSTMPGATALTRIPRGPSAAAKCLTSVSIAPFVANKPPACQPPRAPSDETNTMLLPLPRIGSGFLGCPSQLGKTAVLAEGAPSCRCRNSLVRPLASAAAVAL